MATNVQCGPDTPITVKVTIEKSTRKFKILFSELGPDVLPGKLRSVLEIPDGIPIKFQRWSDSGRSFEELDPTDSGVFKKLARAARAKLKLRIRATVPLETSSSSPYTLPTSSSVTLTNASTAVKMLPSAPTVSQLRIFSTRDALLNNSRGTSVAASNIQPMVPAPGHAEKLQLLRELSLRPKPEDVHTAATAPALGWSVYCNVCDKPMLNEHYHCDTCDNGDYDLCQECVDAGKLCPGEGHWLIKRLIKGGHVITSTTEKISPKPKSSVTDVPSEMPGTYTEDKPVETVHIDDEVDDEEEEEEAQPSRTCNACVNVFLEDFFVTCEDCDDFDLCLPCHENQAHGHHPGHTFKPATKATSMSSAAKDLCAPGRDIRHAAICDGCDKTIFGVRHKCLTCPDWDYCSECIKNARYIHPSHRFAPLYDPIPEPYTINPRHTGIYCDGPLCKDKHEYITGTRYKCAICHDTDFCGNCEASPRNRHNRTHPLIKFKTPVRNVSVTTMEEGYRGEALATMGDKYALVHPVAPNAPSPVRTVADIKPSTPVTPQKTKEKIEIKDLLAEPIEEKIKVEDLKPITLPSAFEYNAHYVRDTVKDGSIMTPNQKFVQVWTLRNPGPNTWPAGCVVSWVGGDRMFDIDDTHPSSEADLAAAQRSNIVGRTVDVGEEIAFRVMMKAPKHEGTAISYWRLKSADGLVFGHRLWCHVKVVAAPQAPNYTISPPPAVSVPTVERTESVGRPEIHQDFLAMLLRNQEHRARLQTQMAREAEEKKQRDLLERENRAKILEAVRKEIEAANKQSMLERTQALINAAVNAPAANDKEQKESAAAELAATTPSVKVEPTPATVESEDGKKEGSAMIFPKLEKESPASSTHESFKSAEAPQTSTTKTTKPDSEADIFEDAESVELLDSSDDDGFLTDEEYDILDASDEEHTV